MAAAPAKPAVTTTASLATATVPVPLPPPAPARAAATRLAVPAPTRLAGSQTEGPKPGRARIADARPAAGSAPDPASAADDDHVDVFGIAVPTIGATGRRLQDAVGAFGDAVANLTKF